MKKLEELGISPAPWKIRGEDFDVIDANNEIVVEYQFVKPDIRLIAAAPELYDAAERYMRFLEESCVHGSRSARKILADANRAFKDLKAALAKAAGESEKE